jgi:hypothetical protein
MTGSVPAFAATVFVVARVAEKPTVGGSEPPSEVTEVHTYLRSALFVASAVMGRYADDM